MTNRTEQDLRLDTLKRNLEQGSNTGVVTAAVAVVVGLALVLAFQIFSIAPAMASR